MTGVGGMSMRDLTASRLIGSAADINDKGQVVGWFSVGTGTPGDLQAFITGPNGAGMAGIAPDPDETGWLFIVPSSINAAGQVAGSAGDPSRRPFITGEHGVGIRDIAGLPSHPYVAHATAINDAGRVAGMYLTDGIELRSFITGPDGVGITELATLGGGSMLALGINNAGQVVGMSYTASGGASHAFITGPNGEGTSDLNSLVDLPGGIVLTEAWGINNVGQVIAVGVIPEPESYAMFLAGLGLLGFMARRTRLLV